MRISNFIIGIVLVALVGTVFGSYYSHISSQQSVTYDNSTLEAYNKFDDIEETASEMNETLTQIKQGSAVDIIGGLLTSGYTVMKTTWISFDAYTSMVNSGVSDLKMENSGYFINTALIVVFLLFMFALISILVKFNV